MRVLVAGWLKFDKADCSEMIRAGEQYIRDSLNEEGCIAYRWAVDPLEHHIIHVFEEWVSEESLGKHMRDPSYLAMRDHLQSHTLVAFDVNLYSAGAVTSVYTDQGQPRDIIFGVPVSG